MFYVSFNLRRQSIYDTAAVSRYNGTKNESRNRTIAVSRDHRRCCPCWKHTCKHRLSIFFALFHSMNCLRSTPDAGRMLRRIDRQKLNRKHCRVNTRWILCIYECRLELMRITRETKTNGRAGWTLYEINAIQRCVTMIVAVYQR